MKKKIALIEDDRVLANAIHGELIDTGFDVVQAFDGEEGWKLIQSEKPDLVLLNIILPKIEGISVLKMIKEDNATKNIPVIILTVLSDTRKIADAVELGAEAYLVKGDQELKHVVEAVKEKLKMK